MPVKKDVFTRAALRKGFYESRSGDHIYYRFEQSDGKEIPRITTKMSHGGGNDLPDSLLTKMARQMKFDKKSDLIKFVECEISGEDYREILVSKGIIRR